MTYTQNLWLFFVFLFGIIIVPGMDMLFVITNALTSGRRAGLSATGGIMLGGAAHAFIGALGVGLLLKLAPTLFTLLLFAGAAYMGWIGVTLMRSAIVISAIGAVANRSLWVAFRQGALTCLLNPKAYLFTLAIFPQFIRPQYGPLWSQALAMGAMIVLTQLGVYGGLAFAAGASRDFLVSTPRATLFAGRAAGLLFIVVAALAAWHGWTAASFVD
ncbi:LysE family translocator [Methylocapsa sp. S129]|uniref:LysE family translocator n=1 Tax=Methylocapsa sp. S129 TaxID=1641869 RepID=UPI00131E54B7|nr:LysE family translocator [Methylocapsa sp. S129]